MEENVALDSSKQKKFVKSIKGIKKLIKKNDTASEVEIDQVKTKDGKIRKRRRMQRGLVYLSHIPHGFYEHQMTQYFKQFGLVTNARVIRSKRTGNSKGHAFVEFKEPSVAEIVAETMNNYLMGKRLIKAAYIPPEKQKRKAMRKHWNARNNPGNNLRIKMKKAHNANKDEKGDLKKAKQLLSNLTRTKKKLSEMGINYDFFTPVDVPEVLLGTLTTTVKQEDESKEVITTGKNDSVKLNKKNKKESQATLETNNTIKQSEGKKGKNKKLADNAYKTKQDKPKNAANEGETGKAKQKKKQQELTEKDVKLLEDFIKIQENSDDSDSSYVFDSDEYDKMIENEDEFNSNISGESSAYDSDELKILKKSKNKLSTKLSSKGSNDELDARNVDDTDGESDAESVEDMPPPKRKGKTPVVVPQVQTKKNARKQQQIQKKLPQQLNRKASHTEKEVAVITTKKPKFEKQYKQKSTNKQFKKKK